MVKHIEINPLFLLAYYLNLYLFMISIAQLILKYFHLGFKTVQYYVPFCNMDAFNSVFQLLP
jgi:hypothetical protein